MSDNEQKNPQAPEGGVGPGAEGEAKAPAPGAASGGEAAPKSEAQAAATDAPAQTGEAAPPATTPPAVPLAQAAPPAPPAPKEDEDKEEQAPPRMSLMDHLTDLRKRLVRSLIAVAAGFFVCYPVSGRMLRILMDPMLNVLNQSHFIYTKLPEAFLAEMKISFVAGLFLVSPYVFHQIWKFVAPGLYAHERKWILPIAVASAVCFVAGALFGYFVVFPFGFSFFASYSSDVLQFMPNLGEFLDFALKILIAFGVIFELPLFMFFMARLGVVSSKALRRWRKYAVLVAFIVGAILTPPDAISQTLMAVPLCLLYELGIWLAYFFGKERGKRDEERKAAGEAKAAEKAKAAEAAKPAG